MTEARLATNLRNGISSAKMGVAEKTLHWEMLIV